ncbi:MULTISPECIES: RagB/SusD family nutrient uptake outer membrane protein [unclassified Empedobacter]|uniref:RagB/SusD family nutrient uptake outer membrane protein n=1 Tax=unclassified Empedobacter TaxID=2643773 RepID=UPI0025BE8DE5|nr:MULTISPECIES: RagB/SusD family nutrient uptake outer membrane protein [unclassified Empedobacter]
MKSIFIHFKQGLIALILLTSCDNFLDLDTPNTQLVSAEVFEDKKTTDAALLNIYASLRDNGLFTGNNSGMTYLLGLYTDELDLYSINLLGQKEFYEHTLSTRNELVLTSWNTSYNQIYRLNALIEGVEKSTLLENQYKQTVLAEAYTMRGMLHMYLTQLFGEIPYITTTDYLQNKLVHKTPEKEIYERIEQDYLVAEELFLKGTKNTSKTRLNLTSLKTLKAKYYAQTKQWEKAKQHANDVIQTAGVTLEQDLNKEFLKISSSVIWHFSPHLATGNSLEADVFMLNALPPAFVSLKPTFVNSFEKGDQRKEIWIKKLNNNQGTWYQPYKYKAPNASSTVNVENSVVLRLAELYLIRAEANFQLSNFREAEKDLNLIRKRANLPMLSNLSQHELEQAILDEYKHELFTEYGHRFFDLKRWNRLNELQNSIPTWKPFMEKLPLPEKEILLNNNLKPQNDGY